MGEERIIIDVDDSALDIAIAKAMQLASLETAATKVATKIPGAKKIVKEAEVLQFTLTPVTDEMEVLQYRLAQLGMTDLPSLNREMRVIFGTVPGAREAMQVFFRVKRAQMAAKEAIEIGQFLTPNVIITLIATMVIVMRAIWRHHEMLERDKREYEKMVRQFRGWTKDEFKENMKVWQGRAGGMVR
jgi:hypothetical protein